jgi:hypothetical protein
MNAIRCAAALVVASAAILSAPHPAAADAGNISAIQSLKPGQGRELVQAHCALG